MKAVAVKSVKSPKKPAKFLKPVKALPVIAKASAKVAVKAPVMVSAKSSGKVSSKTGRSALPAQTKPEPYQMQSAPAVATNLKPRKSQIGLGVRELEHYADLLLAKRRELVGDMSSMEREALRSGGSSNLSTLPVHMADMGTDNYEQEFTLGLVEKDRNLLREINHALAKIQNGTYGICEGTGIPIGKPRLEAQPWARFSIEYARQKEKNGMGVRTL
jgi:DnaK suppressor protein